MRAANGVSSLDNPHRLSYPEARDSCFLRSRLVTPANMRGLSTAAVLLAPALAWGVTLESPEVTIPSAYIYLQPFDYDSENVGRGLVWPSDL